MTKPLHPWIKSLRALERALRPLDDEGREANLKWAWDRYVEQPKRDARKEA